MLQVKNLYLYNLELDTTKPHIVFDHRPKYLEELRDYEPPFAWVPCKKLGGDIIALDTGTELYSEFEETGRDFVVELDTGTMRRIRTTCKSVAKKINGCSSAEQFMKLFAQGTPAQSLIQEFSRASDKVDLSLDLMFAQLVRERITDEHVIGKLSPDGSFPKDKLDALAMYLVSVFNIHDYWKNYYWMRLSQEAVETARQSYVNSFFTGGQDV
jgi:hypothetical protein